MRDKNANVKVEMSGFYDNFHPMFPCEAPEVDDEGEDDGDCDASPTRVTGNPPYISLLFEVGLLSFRILFSLNSPPR